jgi:ribosomal protein L28
MEVERNIELACLLTGSSTFKVAGWITRFAAVLSLARNRPRHERQPNIRQAKNVHAILLRFTKLRVPAEMLSTYKP